MNLARGKKECQIEKMTDREMIGGKGGGGGGETRIQDTRTETADD